MEKSKDVILMAKCENIVHPAKDEVHTGEVLVTVTDAFRTIFDRIDDGELTEQVCTMIRDDIFSDVTTLSRGVFVLLEDVGIIDAMEEPLNTKVEYFLNEENELGFSVDMNLDDIFDGIMNESNEDECFIADVQVGGLIKAFCLTYGQNCREKWEEFINFGFNEPEQFGEFIRETYLKDE